MNLIVFSNHLELGVEGGGAVVEHVMQVPVSQLFSLLCFCIRLFKIIPLENFVSIRYNGVSSS